VFIIAHIQKKRKHFTAVSRKILQLFFGGVSAALIHVVFHYRVKQCLRRFPIGNPLRRRQTDKTGRVGFGNIGKNRLSGNKLGSRFADIRFWSFITKVCCLSRWYCAI
jgi:hypothetical protein